MGFDSFDSLAVMDDPAELVTGLGINLVQAKLLIYIDYTMPSTSTCRSYPAIHPMLDVSNDPHYGAIAVKNKLLRAADLCYNKVQPTNHRNQLQVALDRYVKSLAYMLQVGQLLGDGITLRYG